MGSVGLGFFSVGMLGLAYLSLIWIANQTGMIAAPKPIGNRPLLAYSIAASLLGGQALSLGLLAELIVANTTRTAGTAPRSGNDEIKK